MRSILFSGAVVVALWMGSLLLPGCMSDLNPDQLRCTETDGCPSGYICRTAAFGTTGMCCKTNDLKCGVLSDAAVIDSKVTDAQIITDVPIVDDGPLAADVPVATDVSMADDATIDEGLEPELDSAGEDSL